MIEQRVFAEHAAKAGEEYGLVREEYRALADAVRHLLTNILDRRTHSIHTISSREKSVESFRAKVAQPHPDDPTRPKYQKPLEELTDLAGVRVVTYVQSAVRAVEAAILANFRVIERDDKGKQLETEGRLGYQSVHFIVQFNDARLGLSEYSRYRELVCEIQVRTILQHAWAELEHDIRYKSVVEAPLNIARRFTALAGLIEIVDREFQAIQDEDLKLREALRSGGEPSLEAPAPTAEATHAAPSTTSPAHAGPTGDDYTPRELLTLRRYAEAIVKYTEKIQREPHAYTYYLGRARARFLNGDRDGALADIAEARRLVPNNETVERLRQQIELGVVPTEAPTGIVQSGHTALQSGDGATALRFYSEAASKGGQPIFAAINQAMALVLLGRLREAKVALLGVEPHAGSYVEINATALRLMVDTLSGEPVDLPALARLVAPRPPAADGAPVTIYDFSRSPLLFLKQGLEKSAPETLRRLSRVFECLEQAGAR